ncbi:MAG: hypothetical protein JWO32_3059 [Bacteroidetes bacterium]|nr:hypothetical protein [Bacteroidota bacterium]
MILFTCSFPYGKSEQFLESEITLLCKAFEKVIVMPMWPADTIRKIPSNCTVVPLKIQFVPQHKFRYYILNNMEIITRALIYCIINTTNKSYYLKNLKKCVIDLTFLIEESKLIERSYNTYLNLTDVLYFYWFDKPFIHFALLKKQGKIKHRLVSRGLGYDYDPIQNKLGFFPFREMEMEQIDHLVINSKWGSDLVKKLYYAYKKKVKYSYLGLPNPVVLNPLNETGIFHLVSCSYVIELKRIHLIVEILKHIDFPIKWTHIGEGPLLEEIKETARALPRNVISVFPGFIASVIDFYKKKPCDLFITTTWTEGLPFTLAEAIAHGIPVLGTAVCGIPEIANENTGFLIPRDFEPKDAAQIIRNYNSSASDSKLKLRKSARAYFEKKFTAEKNVPDFVDTYLS